MGVPYTILNPHISDFFGKPLSFVLLKRRALKKYSYLIDVPVAEGKKVNILVNGANSGLIPDTIFQKLPAFVQRRWLKFEMKQWLKHNGLEGKAKVHFDVAEIQDRSALLFLCYRNYAFPEALKKAAAQFDIAIGHLSHYYLTPAEYSQATKDIPNLLLASDVDVSQNRFFQHFFPWYHRPMVTLPFVVANRFKSTKPYNERLPKAIATGTFHMLELDAKGHYFSAVRKFAQTNTVHPLRRMIFENKEKVKDTVDCYCYPFYESNMTKKKWYEEFLPKKLQVKQSSYFSFNIVDKYNEYKYAIVGEEFYNGIPGIGAFEAMACGTVLIGHPDCYKGTGLQPNVHFLPHHNDLAEIDTTIREANGEPQRMQEMSERASGYVKAQYNPDALYQRFVAEVKQLQVPA